MRRSRNILTLLRIQFQWANQKKLIFGRYQSYKRRNLKKPRSSGDENGTKPDNGYSVDNPLPVAGTSEDNGRG